MDKLKEYLIPLFGIFFISSIGIIILAVTIPSVVLEPISWLIQTGLEYDSYSSSYKPGQSATYFNYYMGPIDGVYYEISILWLIALGSLLFLPTLLICLNILHYHSSAKEIQKTSTKSYLAALAEKHRQAKIKPAFWMYFLPSVLLIGAIHYDKEKTIVDVIKFDVSSIFESDKMFRPLFLTKHDKHGEITWRSYMIDEKPFHYRKEGKKFSRYSYRNLIINAEAPNGSTLFKDTFAHGISDTYAFRNNEIIITAGPKLIRIDTNTFTKRSVDLGDLAKKHTPTFSKLRTVTKTDSPYEYELTDQFGTQASINLLSDAKEKNTTANLVVNTRMIGGKHHKVRQLYAYRETGKITSGPVIDPDVIYSQNSIIVVIHKSEINKKHNDLVSLYDDQLNKVWQANLGKHYHYLEQLDHIECNELDISKTESRLIINYMGNWNSCATDILDIQSGEKIASYVAGHKV